MRHAGLGQKAELPKHPARLPQCTDLHRYVFDGEFKLSINELVHQYLAEELARALGLWIFKKGYWLVGFYDYSFIHEHDPIGNLFGKAHFVRDTDHRHAAFGQVDHRVEYLGDHFGVECGGWLIEQHDFRVHAEAAGYRYALLLPTG
jgi:hypothetical protein